MTDRDDELVDAVRELTRTIEALRTELDEPRRRRQLPLRPPTPREVLRLTDEVALPAALAVLEASVRTLEAFQRGLRIVRTEEVARDRTTAAAEATSDRASALRETTLSQLDTVLAELNRAVSEGSLPADEGARELLTEARELRDDVDARLREATDRGPQSSASEPSAATGITIDIEDGPPGDAEESSDENRDDSDSAVDVDAELETLRDQYGADAEDAEDAETNGTDSTGDEPDTSDETDGSENSGDGDERP
ncbi:hypothetical protein ACFR99_14115 [Haloarchaeobius amylolyticus]|uniref:Uncharacterized protein n=1 Tax=Haloarchaeobius amylolyticus TaxID=1198296 RepID=A0ABD6BKK4_9EURY